MSAARLVRAWSMAVALSPITCAMLTGEASPRRAERGLQPPRSADRPCVAGNGRTMATRAKTGQKMTKKVTMIW